MDLSRRDALTALAAAGIGTGGAALAYERGVFGDEESSDQIRSLIAIAEVLYPSEVNVTEEFVETYVYRRAHEDPEYQEGLESGLDAIQATARDEYDETFAELSVDDREAVLRNMGLDYADSNPDGTESERIRYYVVNDLLFAFYSSPTGGELVGTENPPGHPGGMESYQRGPDA